MKKIYIDENIDLSEELKKILFNPIEYPHIKTVDDFFDSVSIPKECRSGFIFSAILKGIDQEELSSIMTKEDGDWKEYKKLVDKFGFHKKGIKNIKEI